MEPVISVIIPTYNSEAFIQDCIDCLKEQFFENFEALFTDSDSTDETIAIIKSAAASDDRFKILPVGDCTPGIARNYGIQEARGQYIAFMDSDDLIRKNYLQSLLHTAQQRDSDIVVSDFDMIYPDREIHNFSKQSEKTISIAEENISDYYYEFFAAPKPNNYVWSRLYKRDFIRDTGVRFQDVRYSEDHLFNLSLLIKKPKISHINKSLYKYIQREDSAMRSHVRRTNHGELFLNSFLVVEKLLETEHAREQIMSVYAYTRMKSILFYAWQAGLSQAETKAACQSFTGDEAVKKYLGFCLERGYIDKYCDIHGFSHSWRETVKQMLRACIEGTELPDMKEIFA